MKPQAPDVWGILNVTPDSFSDGGRHLDPETAIERGMALARLGADVLDVGGESTRPGAPELEAEEEASRVVPVIAGLRRGGLPIPVSVDTRKSGVARLALEAGATIVNDVSAGTHDPDLLTVAAEHGAGVVLMHMRGTPETMQDRPVYDDPVAEIRSWLAARVAAAVAAGVPEDHLWVDPGIGFGKTVEHNVEILRRLEEFVRDGCPVLLGASRKSFLGHLTGREVDRRLGGSLACVVRAAEAGVDAVRVHDVAESVDVLRVGCVVGRKPPAGRMRSG